MRLFRWSYFVFQSFPFVLSSRFSQDSHTARQFDAWLRTMRPFLPWNIYSVLYSLKHDSSHSESRFGSPPNSFSPFYYMSLCTITEIQALIRLSTNYSTEWFAWTSHFCTRSAYLAHISAIVAHSTLYLEHGESEVIIHTLQFIDALSLEAYR
jgi:hypothetical protein